MEAFENYNRQHQDVRKENGIAYGDTIDGVDFGYAAKLTALNAVSLASMASAPPPPADVKIEGAVTADTILHWKRPDAAQAPNLAGYRVYWRLTTDPQWSHSVYVGDVSDYTLRNVIIDNYFFGVAAVVDRWLGKPGGVSGRSRQLRRLHRVERVDDGTRRDALARAVRVHFVDERRDVLRIHVRRQAVAQVEHVPIARAAVAGGVAVQRDADLCADRIGRAVQHRRIEVALQRDLALRAARGFLERHRPVDAEAFAAAAGQFFEVGRVALAEQDQRRARVGRRRARSSRAMRAR